MNRPSIILVTLNARYIHASLGLRCLLANLDRYGGAGLRAQSVLREYTVARNVQEVVDDLLHTLGPVSASQGAGAPARQIVGFGVYIWNVAQTTEVLRRLKVARPELIVVLGGPEVSHELDGQAVTALAEHVVTGWGEVSFAKLCRALLDGAGPMPRVLAGEQPELAQLELPYAEYSDTDLAQRLLYVEASRGCPFKCEFCLSSLDRSAWSFAPERLLAALAALYQRGARNFKFVDRTFNLKIDNAVRILEFFLQRLPETGALPAESLFLHFEVVPDHLPQRLRAVLARFPAGVLQLEVGVQSFNPEVQQRISRRQNNSVTQANLRWLLGHTQAHLHVDLVFGLPGETLQSFADGFDQLLALGVQEIQLGLLKRLRGAPIARHTEAHGMVYATEPPYGVLQTGVIDAAGVQRFSRLARYWDLVANSGRFPRTLALLLRPPALADRADSAAATTPTTPFWRFWAWSDWLWQRHGATHRLTPEVLVDALFDYLSDLWPAAEVRQALLADYQASGARANPKALHGLLSRSATKQGKAVPLLATRQQRHLA